MFPDPADVGLQRLGQARQALLELRMIVEENEIEAAQRLGYRFVLGSATDDRREALVERGRGRNFLLTHRRGDGVWTKHEHDRIGLRD